MSFRFPSFLRSHLFSPQIIFAVSLLFLLIRNIPLCFILPIWAHGDEIGHIDYILKIGRGHIPQPRDHIESSLFLFHKTRWDSRIIAPGGNFRIKKIKELGLAGYSYEAHHPPFPYFLLALCRRVFFLHELPFLLQVRIFRLLCLFMITIGMAFIYFAWRHHQVNDLLFYFPLLLISLLSQDMFAAINTDNFSFFCGSIACAGLIYITFKPSMLKGWILLAVGTILALWTKISNIYFFGFWIIPFLAYRKHHQRKLIFSYAFIFLLLALIISSPWYIYNFIRFSSPISDLSLPYPLIPPQGVSFTSLKNFSLAFSRTLFRGEFFWEGRYLDIICGRFNPLFYGILLIFILYGLIRIRLKYIFNSLPLFNSALYFPSLVFVAFFLICCLKGGFPLYHARFSFGELYFIMLLFFSGWKMLLCSTHLAGITTALLLFFYNLLYTINLIFLVR